MWVNNVVLKFEFVEVRSGYNSIGNFFFVRMGDRFFDWGIENGLGLIIFVLFIFGVFGYLFCLLDIIGGNVYFGKYSDEEFFVRWA